MKMQPKCPRVIAKPRTGLHWQRFSPFLCNLFLAIGYIALLFYALVWKAGNIVDFPTKRIGFYNFCLWDQEAEKLNCSKNLEKMGINKIALLLSRICVYTTPVLCLFVASTVLQALCLKDRNGFKLACIVLAVSNLILPVGVALFIFHTEKWVRVSEFGEVFVALGGAHVLMLLHLTLFLAHFKATLPKGQCFPA
ncbi:transmembrane protein 140 [Rhineura floridana]|uniref:transmembrane protein 140 n=1 Tax=Rhineura floridana TaxID=261503 RepID=UPI002AC86463|nr:transmembrane protein 140 [Rhineura floridana]XP_061495427.1 transmembrane protein 140 [Rhineura floridana]XP_061495428.1 transmembrane protein 140 [Rhineura floridana]XP_061495429.1 transmembrane protein 140 [Rhineura floridana]XP_061495430.1 transmembrane protein 140 [Rhineura floridana]XP_061495431.1 transmembrane protein 140 [Rhineura floridana]